MADNRPIVYYDEPFDKWVYRASAVGRSVRCLLTARKGHTPLEAPNYLIKAADAGSRFEPIVKQRLREDGYKIGGEQRSIEIPVGNTAIIRGHLDADYITGGGGEVDPEPHMLEVKSMSARMFRKWELHGFDGFPHYAAQLSCYMTGTGRPALYAIVNRDTEDIIIQAYAVPPVPFADIEAKILQVEELAGGTHFPRCDGDAGYFCPYDYMCDRKDMMFEEVESGTEAVLIRLASDFAEARQAENEIAAQRRAIYNDIVEALGDREKVRAGGYKITYKQVTKPKLNKPALEAFLATYGLTLEAFMETSTFRRLTVNE